MSADFIARIIGMAFFMFAAGALGRNFSESTSLDIYTTTVTFGTLGALFGLIFSPYLSTHPMKALRSKLARVAAEALFAGLIGLVIGLIVAALLTFPLSLLPDPLGSIAPLAAVILFGYFGIALFIMRQTDMMNVFSMLLGRGGSTSDGAGGQNNRTVLLDTSVIIDGRIADIAKTGFLPGTLLIPRFVLNELQYIADSADSLRRQRGRRGMEVLAELQKLEIISVRISDIDVDGVREVDDKLIILARQLRCPVLTNDYNLNRVAELQGVNILNINELANAVKSVVLPGELMQINIIQEGKESSQGVGYMDDGTMVVVESGSRYIGQVKNVSVTKVLQTAAGKMIFARPED